MKNGTNLKAGMWRLGEMGNRTSPAKARTFAEKITNTIALISNELAAQDGIYLRDGVVALLNQSEFCRRAGIRPHTFYASSGKYEVDHRRLTAWLSTVARVQTKKEAERAIPRRMRKYKSDIEKLAANYQIAEQQRLVLAERVASLNEENGRLKVEVQQLRLELSDRRVIPMAKKTQPVGR